MLEELLKEKKCFKLICGAGNEDVETVEKLVAVYASAGCNFFDVCADNEVINAAQRGINRAKSSVRKYLCVSVGTKNDAHFQKAGIDKTRCLNCYKCVSNCPQKAISSDFEVSEEKCIGCGKCEISCPANCIFFQEKRKELKQIFEEIPLENIDCIELHIGEEADCYEKWNFLRNNFSGMLSICIGRKKFGDEKFIEILTNLLLERKPYSSIIQADGSPMSGGVDDFETTLQAVATGDLVQKNNIEQYLILSGGTNSKTAELAKMCAVEINGVAIGSFARKTVSEFIEREDFWDNEEVFKEAVDRARKLICNLFG